MCELVCVDCPFDVENTIKEMHEIHITVTGNNDKFYTLCRENGIKPLAMEIPTMRESQVQLMTSQIVQGNRKQALYEMERIYNILSDNGFPVSRIKIESSTEPEIHDGNDTYFEGHLSFDIQNDIENIFFEVCNSVGEKYHVRKSNNAFKHGPLSRTWIVTYRKWKEKSRKNFTNEMNSIKEEFVKLGFFPKKMIIEYAWMDTNFGLDRYWRIE